VCQSPLRPDNEQRGDSGTAIAERLCGDGRLPAFSAAGGLPSICKGAGHRVFRTTVPEVCLEEGRGKGERRDILPVASAVRAAMTDYLP